MASIYMWIWHQIHHVIFFCSNGIFYSQKKSSEIKQQEMNFRLHDFCCWCCCLFNFLCVFWYFKCKKSHPRWKFDCVAGSGLSKVSSKERHKNAVATSTLNIEKNNTHSRTWLRNEGTEMYDHDGRCCCCCFFVRSVLLSSSSNKHTPHLHTHTQPTRKVPTHQQWKNEKEGAFAIQTQRQSTTNRNKKRQTAAVAAMASPRATQL